MKIITSIKTLSLVILSAFASEVISQSEGVFIDSLKVELTQNSGNEWIIFLEGLAYEYKFSNPDSSYKYAKLHLTESLKSTDQKQIALGHNSLANAYQSLSISDSAIFHHKISLAIKSDLSDSLGMADSYNNLGIIQDEMGRYSAASTYYLKALPLYEKYSQDSFKLAGTINNLGIVYKNQAEYNTAIEYYKRSLEIYNLIGSKFGSHATSGNIGSLYLKTEDYDSAIEYSNDALQGYKELGYRKYEPYSLHNLGIAYFGKGELSHAEKLFREAINIYEETTNTSELASVHVDLAKLYNKQKKNKSALAAANKALAHAQISSSKEYEVEAYGQAAFAYLGINNTNQAEAYFIKYHDGKSDLFEGEKTKTIFELKTEYETEKKEQQIKVQELEINNQLSKNKFQKGIFGSILLALILGGLTWFNRIRYKKRIELQELKLQSQQAEYQAIFHGQEQERKRLARDLHDGLGQLLSSARMNVSALEDAPLSNEDIPILENSLLLIDKAVTEVRNVSHDLMPKVLSNEGLIPALESISKRLMKSGKHTLTLNGMETDISIPENITIQVYRILQELINNSIKHSNGNITNLSMRKVKNQYIVLVSDNGRGVTLEQLEKGSGLGWSNIKSRAEMINGSVTLSAENIFELKIPISI